MSVQVIDDIHLFFENNKDIPVFLYGAGRFGAIIGEFMNAVNITYEAYIDCKYGGAGYKLNNHRIDKIEVLELFNEVKIFITPEKYNDILLDIFKYDSTNDVKIICLISLHKNWTGIGYYINYTLGYFRNLLIKSEPLTIVGNDCIAGIMYKTLGIADGYLTPTINTLIYPEDYLKIVQNPEHYLRYEMEAHSIEINHRISGVSERVPVGRIDDVYVRFTHLKEVGEKDLTKCVSRWNYMKQNINWDRIVFIFRSGDGKIPRNFYEQIKKSKYSYRVIHRSLNSGIDNYNTDDHHTLYNSLPFESNIPIETYGFDYVGWYKQIIDEIEEL